MGRHDRLLLPLPGARLRHRGANVRFALARHAMPRPARAMPHQQKNTLNVGFVVAAETGEWRRRSAFGGRRGCELTLSMVDPPERSRSKTGPGALYAMARYRIQSANKTQLPIRMMGTRYALRKCPTLPSPPPTTPGRLQPLFRGTTFTFLLYLSRSCFWGRCLSASLLMFSSDSTALLNEFIMHKVKVIPTATITDAITADPSC